MTGKIYIGIGGWTFEPWRGTFYPDDLTQKRELEYASRKLTSIEINGTYYSSFKPASWAKWRDDTPEGFVFAVKASRFCTNRRVLAEAGESVQRFVTQGLVELGARLGPINWQFMGTKKFDPADFEAFLKLLLDWAYAFVCMHREGVMHADVHLNNLTFTRLGRTFAVELPPGADTPRATAYEYYQIVDDRGARRGVHL